MKRPELMYEKVIEVHERVRIIGSWETVSRSPPLFNRCNDSANDVFFFFFVLFCGFCCIYLRAAHRTNVVKGMSGELVEVLRAPDLDELRPKLQVQMCVL
jgi:hypothetical protein